MEFLIRITVDIAETEDPADLSGNLSAVVSSSAKAVAGVTSVTVTEISVAEVPPEV